MDAASATLKEGLRSLKKGFPPGAFAAVARQRAYSRRAEERIWKRSSWRKSFGSGGPVSADTADAYYLLEQAWSQQQRYGEAWRNISKRRRCMKRPIARQLRGWTAPRSARI